MDRFPPSEDGPHFELAQVAHSLEDLAPAEIAAPRSNGVAAPLAFSVLALLALIAFVGWLLVG